MSWFCGSELNLKTKTLEAAMIPVAPPKEGLCPQSLKNGLINGLDSVAFVYYESILPVVATTKIVLRLMSVLLDIDRTIRHWTVLLDIENRTIRHRSVLLDILNRTIRHWKPYY